MSLKKSGIFFFRATIFLFLFYAFLPGSTLFVAFSLRKRKTGKGWSYDISLWTESGANHQFWGPCWGILKMEAPIPPALLSVPLLYSLLVYLLQFTFSLIYSCTEGTEHVPSILTWRWLCKGPSASSAAAGASSGVLCLESLTLSSIFQL